MTRTETPRPSLPVEDNFGPYFLERLIASGGMAEIYLARTQGLAGFEKRVALKAIHADLAADDDFVQMLVAEAKLAVTLTHANIVQTFDLGKIEETYFITMEHVDGADLFFLLKTMAERERELPAAAALYVVAEISLGLEYAHSKRTPQDRPSPVVHRDISPQNILLSRYGEVKIADFGIAKVANVSGQTQAGVIKGKLGYMSPEQAWGERVDQRSDIFSAGIVLYEALTGRALYNEENPVKLLHRVRKAEIPPPSSVRSSIDGELDALVMKALQRDPNARYQSAAELGSAVTKHLGRLGPDYGRRELGGLVRSVLGEESEASGAEPSEEPTVPPGEPLNPAIGSRSDHSLLFSAEEATTQEPSSSDSVPDLTPYPDNPAIGGSSARLILLGEGEPKTYEVGKEFVIGRGGDMRLSDGRVSRAHARILPQDRGGYLVEDLDSSNGTYVNRKRVRGSQPLQSNDILRVGPYEIRFVAESEEDTTSSDGPPRSISARTAVDDAAVLGEEQALTPPSADSLIPTPKLADVHDRITPKLPNLPSSPAYLVVDLGGESLRLPLDRRLPMQHSYEVGELAADGAAAAIDPRPDGYWLEPDRTRSTVLLNDEPVEAPRLLQPGDKVSLGPVDATFRVEKGTP